MHDVVSQLTAWESFYVIVGSSSAALTGLMFVVVTLVPDVRTNSPDEGISAFGTPTVVHFCAALLVSVTFAAPWNGLAGPALMVGLVGAAGFGYIVIVLRRARRQVDYKPVFEDWMWHFLLPFAAYLTFAVSGILLIGRPVGALFGIGTAAALLLFAGIHNAWDSVIYLALQRSRLRDAPETDTHEAAKNKRGHR